MTKILTRLLLASATLTGMQGCIYMDVTVPLDTDVNKTELGSKIGRASNQSVLWLFAWGDAGVEAAAKQGGLTVIRHLDSQEYLLLFGVYASQTTVAYGD